MIKRLTPLLFALGTLPVLAQEAPKPDPTQVYSLLDGKTIIKTNPFSDIFGNLNLKVERIITDGLSALPLRRVKGDSSEPSTTSLR